METIIHKFEDAGLGKAPFRFVAVYETAGTSCAYCGTGIKWACEVRSTDGKRFVVGSDCIEKVGDRGLFDLIKAERNKIAREARHAAAEAVRLVALDAQRAANGGATDWEREEADRLNTKNNREIAKRPAVEALAPFVAILEDGQGGFLDSIADAFRTGSDFSNSAFRIACEIVAKEAGRKNSNAYNARLAEVEPVISNAIALIRRVNSK